MNGAAARPVVGLFGAFDTGELGEVALRRVLEAELIRRRPDIDIVALAPFGAERPIPGDDGRPALPLRRAADAAGPGLDALIITGDVLRDDEHWAIRYPAPVEAMADRGVAILALRGKRDGRDAAAWVTWFAVGPAGGDVDTTGLAGREVWARDLATQQRLGGTAVQSGDPMLLAGRVFPPDALRRRADLLRLCGALPTGRRLVVEMEPGLAGSAAGNSVIDAIAQLMRSDPRLSVVGLTLDPTRDSAFRVPGLVAERVHHLPVWAGLDDIAAAMSGAAGVVASSPAGAHLAASLRVPVSALDTGIGDRFDSAIPVIAGDITAAIQALLAGRHPVPIDAALQTLDGALAELAERLPRAAAGGRTTVEPDAGGSALAILQQRLVDERTALQAELSRVEAELDHLQGSPEHRIARPIRAAYRRWQRRRT